MKPKRLNWRATRTGFIFFCTFILIIGVKAQVVTDGLVSYYTLDKNDIAGDTVKDVVGGKDGTIRRNHAEFCVTGLISRTHRKVKSHLGAD